MCSVHSGHARGVLHHGTGNRADASAHSLPANRSASGTLLLASLRSRIDQRPQSMPNSRTIIIAGAGIGGLSLALALARAGFRAVVLEQAARLEETGAGIQLSPNATRILFGLGLAGRLRPHIVAPDAIRIVRGASGGDIVRIPLGPAEERYGAPYWVVHRA